MTVLHDYVSKHITPLQERTRPVWLYTGVNDITRLERDNGSTLGKEALALVMGKLSPDPSSHDFVTPPASCQPFCMDQAVRTLLLVAMPSMDDVGIAPIQRGDQSRGVQIHGTGAVGGQGGAVSISAPSKGKGKVVRVVHNDDEVSSDSDVPLQRRMRAPDRGRSMVGKPPRRLLRRGLTHQQRHGQRRLGGPAAARLQTTQRQQQGPLQRKRLRMQLQ
jgi:hypothetical protein